MNYHKKLDHLMNSKQHIILPELRYSSKNAVDKPDHLNDFVNNNIIDSNIQLHVYGGLLTKNHIDIKDVFSKLKFEFEPISNNQIQYKLPYGWSKKTGNPQIILGIADSEIIKQVKTPEYKSENIFNINSINLNIEILDQNKNKRLALFTTTKYGDMQSGNIYTRFIVCSTVFSKDSKRILLIYNNVFDEKTGKTIFRIDSEEENDYEQETTKWLNENYPNWEDPFAYWN